MQQEFQANAVLHFGMHGTGARSPALRCAALREAGRGVGLRSVAGNLRSNLRALAEFLTCLDSPSLLQWSGCRACSWATPASPGPTSCWVRCAALGCCAFASCQSGVGVNCLPVLHPMPTCCNLFFLFRRPAQRVHLCLQQPQRVHHCQAPRLWCVSQQLAWAAGRCAAELQACLSAVTCVGACRVAVCPQSTPLTRCSVCLCRHHCVVQCAALRPRRTVQAAGGAQGTDCG